ncbi:MAG TPA: bifunctional riboflavin kinase/FAD synthetase [Candidatus Dormibacteraeota bacterium]|nr:bifunctional riboflavin kinase/FAD synthetase [Candidatus Dormibacteraeota bacterium]
MPFANFFSAEEWAAHFPAGSKPTAIAIGNFDGLHLGHQQILGRVLERARQENSIAAVLTFYPHPTQVLRPADAPALLMTLDQRLAAIAAMGLDAALVIRFDAHFAKISPEDFVRRYAVDTMHARMVAVGKTFRFGHRQAGDVNTLSDLGKLWNFQVESVAPVVADGVVVSSTAIRKYLREGGVEEATRMLGRPYALEGQIRTGTGMGRKFVVPTLNLSTEQQLLPKLGVYATEVSVAGGNYRAATNIGMRPTFDGARVTIESYLLDFSETLTSGPMIVRFLSRLRDEMKFSGPEALRQQILADIEHVKKYFLTAKQ